MNSTVARLTWHSLLGRRRALLLMLLPLVLVALAVLVRLVHGSDPKAAANLLGTFAVGFLVPLLALIAGTGAIGPEIDDGSIVYLLAKPIGRPTIVHSKLAVAIVVTTGLGALPTLLAGLIVTGGSSHVAVGFALGTLIGGIVYSTIFLMLAIVTRNAVIIGLLYALVWEGVVGGYVPGAQALSVQQWTLSLTTKVIGRGASDLDVTSAVSLPVGIVLLVVAAIASTVYAGRRLRSIRLTSDE